MALSITSTPGALEPVYQNSMMFLAASTYATFSNFRYIFDVYTNTNYTTTGGSFKTRVNPFPRPDGVGMYSPHYVLRDNVSYKLQPNISSPTANTQSIINYYLKLGEEWNPLLSWYDTQWISGALGLTFSTPHGLLVGDLLLLDKTDKSLNPQYDGTCSVVAVTSPTSITTDKLFGDSSTAEGGEVTDVLRMSYTSSILRAFNGTRQYDEIDINFTNDYVLSVATDSFLTSYNGVKRNYVYDLSTISYIAATSGVIPTHAVFNFYNKTTGITGTYGMTVSTTASRVDVPTGYANAILRNDSSLSLPLINVLAAGENGYYTVRMATWSSYPSGSPTYLSQPFTYSIMPNHDSGAFGCSTPTGREFDLIQIAFLNKYGAFEYMTFALVNKRTIKVNRKKYKKVLAYNYIMGDRGNTIFDMNVTEELTLNSDWLNDEEALLVSDLISSPEVYIIQQYPSNSSTWTINNVKYLPVIVTTDSYTIKNTLNDQLFNFTLMVEMAFNTYTNI